MRSRLENNVREWAARASKLGGVVGGCHIDRLNGFGWWNINLQQAGTLVVIDALNCQLVELARLTIHLGGECVLGIEEVRVIAMRTHGPGNQCEQTLEVAIGAA